MPQPLFRIELDPPKSGNKTLRTSWRKRHEENQGWGWLIYEAFQKAQIDFKKIPKQDPNKRRYIVVYLESNKPQDDNNFQLAIKGLIDEFQEGRTVNAVIDDSPQYCRVFYVPVKTKIKKRRMFLELYEQEEFLKAIDTDSAFKAGIFSL